MNQINDKLLDELAMFLFENKEDLKVYEGGKLLVDVGDDGELRFELE